MEHSRCSTGPRRRQRSLASRCCDTRRATAASPRNSATSGVPCATTRGAALGAPLLPGGGGA
eukprot:11189068-Lingulodinium_polyedra.AAC.1